MVFYKIEIVFKMGDSVGLAKLFFKLGVAWNINHGRKRRKCD